MPGEHLHTEAGGGDVGLRTLQLGHRTPRAAGPALREQPGRAVGEQPSRVDVGLKVGHRVRERLELTDRTSERAGAVLE